MNLETLMWRGSALGETLFWKNDVGSHWNFFHFWCESADLFVVFDGGRVLNARGVCDFKKKVADCVGQRWWAPCSGDHLHPRPFYQKQHWRTLLLPSPSAFPYSSFLPPPGFLHTPDGGHLAPPLSRHSPPVFSAPGAGRRGGSAHPPGAHSHSAGKAAAPSLDEDSPLTPPLSSYHLSATSPLLSFACYSGLVFTSCIDLHFPRLSVVVKLTVAHFCQEFSGVLSPSSFSVDSLT